MKLINGVTYEEIKKPQMGKSKQIKQESKSNKVVTGMNFDNCQEIIIPAYPETTQPTTTTNTKRSSNNKSVSTTGMIPIDEKNPTKYSANEPYIDKYQETNMLLKTAITQLDIGLQDMQQDLNLLRNNKTLRNKYQQISLVQGNMGSFLGNKITAIRELNSVISKCNDLELKRAKDLKELENEDDDKRIMDLYNAMISMPVGGQSGMMSSGFSTPIGPNTFEMTYAGNPNSNSSNIITGTVGQDEGYETYLMNKTPAQNMMSLDSNPNIQQVVVYNNMTGQTYFEIMDMSTMQPVPNTEKYDSSFLEDTHLDFVNNVATNINLGESYPIITIGQNIALSEY